MNNVTFLGPVGATFSHDAYDMLAEIYDAPQVIADGAHTNCIPASVNTEILKLIAQHGGYGAVAMETKAEARVTETLESFVKLLQTYSNGTFCPFHVSGAIKMKLHFCLMVRQDVSRESIKGIIAHPKALGACKEHIASMKFITINTSSNGEAARLVAEDDRYASYAALGPKSASLKYGLHVLDETFEDSEAITTFFLITPTTHKVVTGKRNRALAG